MGGQKEFLKQSNYGRFAAAGVADQRNGLARLRDKRNIGQDGTAFLIFEMNIVEFDTALDSGDGFGCRKVFPFGFQINQAEEAFRAGHGREGLVVLVTNHLDWFEEKIREKKERHQIA